jgi:hypothetical protein
MPIVELLLRHKGQSLLQEQRDQQYQERSDTAYERNRADTLADRGAAADLQFMNWARQGLATGAVTLEQVQQVAAARQAGGFEGIEPDRGAQVESASGLNTQQLLGRLNHPLADDEDREVLGPILEGRDVEIPGGRGQVAQYELGPEGKYEPNRALHPAAQGAGIPSALGRHFKDQRAEERAFNAAYQGALGSVAGSREAGPAPGSGMTTQQALSAAMEFVTMPEEASLVAMQLGEMFGMAPPPGAVASAVGGDEGQIALINEVFARANQILESTPNAAPGRFTPIPTGGDESLRVDLEGGPLPGSMPLSDAEEEALQLLVGGPDPRFNEAQMSPEQKARLAYLRGLSGGG